MLSYQHIYHAGNPADVHKHALLAACLDYMVQKEKPLSYLETHSGRGLYDLGSAEALKTGEYSQGIDRLRESLAPASPYLRALRQIEAQHGPKAYPGSPLIAQALLRDCDTAHFAELHPKEFSELCAALRGTGAHCHKRDGFEMAQALCPPTPRRGMMLIDPSYELKDDFARLPKIIAQLHRKWNVGVIALWYPILTTHAQTTMVKALCRAHPQALSHEVRFAPVRSNHRMIGSGLFVLNPPFGLTEAAAPVTALFRAVE
ncbi:MAG: 23S rRNA (adenine(2030)-N(6))-methyltransferase RlmJ [Rhodobacteraceae bacterium]|nr:23S rRNA (adenine(2030)-N(6))-methyltransferase RlmJ [Paracoccaceae bacterium]